MIELERVTVRYDEHPPAVLRDVTLSVGEGEFVLVSGPTGSGKSTLLGLLNGLVPHFTGGTVSGLVSVGGRRTSEHPPREFAAEVGMVGQDPLAGFVTDSVEEELAYGMEQLGVAPEVMRQRVEHTLDLLGIAELRDRSPRTLSGGQQQRVAIGAVLTSGPRVLVLDEPTSALDPVAADEVLAALTRLVHDLGLTVIISEHRLERVLQYADRLILLDGSGLVRSGAPADLMQDAELVPPVVGLGRLAGWSPLPLSVRDARRQAGPLRARLGPPARLAAPRPSQALLVATGVRVNYGAHPAVVGVDLQIPAGQRVALMGRNGAGKSSLLWALTGLLPKAVGRIVVAGLAPGPAQPGLVAMVPQTAADLLYLPTVADECHTADAQHHAAPGSCAELLERIAPGIDPTKNPRDLSEGQRLAVALAVQLLARPRVLLLDEPTRGLDYQAKERLHRVLVDRAAAGISVVVATHDVEFAADLADRVVVMAGGEVVADGAAAAVLGASPAFAPQVARVLYPLPWLTVTQVRDALLAARSQPEPGSDGSAADPGGGRGTRRDGSYPDG